MWTPSGWLVAISPVQTSIQLVDTLPGQPQWSTASRQGPPTFGDISRDGKLLAVGTQLGKILLLDPKTGLEVQEPLTHGTEWVSTIALPPQGDMLVSGDRAGTLKMWNLSHREAKTLPTAHEEKIAHAEFSPDGSLLVTAGGVEITDTEVWSHKGEV